VINCGSQSEKHFNFPCPMIGLLGVSQCESVNQPAKLAKY
jgi:hypothetical protein